jgi:hypothetical protein
MRVAHTLTKNVLRELIADTLREHWGQAPGDLADAVLNTLKTYAPKSFIDERRDVDAEEKYVEVAREMILAHAFDVAEWEIKAAYPRLSDMEVEAVDDLIGQARVTVEF